MVKQRLNAHEYQQSENVQKLRSMDNLYLLEFKELSLKNYKRFEDGIKFFTESKFSEYLKRFLVIFPGDHLMHFFSHQIIYSHTYNGNQNTPDVQQALSSNCSSNVENSQLNNDKLSSVDHSYTKNTYSSYNTSTKLTSLTHNIYQSFIAFIGGLHVQLNGQGDIMGNYHQFLKFVYENLFKNCIPALKPKPWRTSNLFEIVYGGWTLIRVCVIAKFADNKSVEYAIIFTLLDTYIPLCISIYSVIFKSNKFKEFKKAMTRIWLMFRCFRRRHYDKSPLIWLSHLMFWEK